MPKNVVIGSVRRGVQNPIAAAARPMPRVCDCVELRSFDSGSLLMQLMFPPFTKMSSKWLLAVRHDDPDYELPYYLAVVARSSSMKRQASAVSCAASTSV